MNCWVAASVIKGSDVGGERQVVSTKSDLGRTSFKPRKQQGSGINFNLSWTVCPLKQVDVIYQEVVPLLYVYRQKIGVFTAPCSNMAPITDWYWGRLAGQPLVYQSKGCLSSWWTGGQHRGTFVGDLAWCAPHMRRRSHTRPPAPALALAPTSTLPPIASYF